MLKLKPRLSPPAETAYCPHGVMISTESVGGPDCTSCMMPAPEIDGLPYVRCEKPSCPQKAGELEDPRVEHVTLAKDMDTDMEYVNVQHHHIGAQYKIMKALRGTTSGDVKITFWADNLKEWLECDVPPNYRFTNDPAYIAIAARPTKASAEVRRARAAHLGQYKRVRSELPPEPAQPTLCIVGQIGTNKVLVDPGNGDVVHTSPLESFNAARDAEAIGRTLVPQKEATLYAITKLRRAWADAKEAK